ncbi:MAG: hypothetical protein V4724_35260 [Pseudomonadota bacterium]
MTLHTTNALPGNVYSPPTGISRFSATYDDVANILDVEVRGTVEFLTPVGKQAWTQQRNGNFLTLFADGIRDVWSAKFPLARRGVQVRPNVHFTVVQPQGNPHLRITVQAGVSVPEIAAHIQSTSHMTTFPAGLDVANGNLILRLDEGTVLPYHQLIPPVTTASLQGEHASQAEVYTGSATLATTALSGKSGHIVFPRGSAALTTGISGQIDGAMGFMREITRNGMGRVPLEITGYRNTNEAAGLSRQRADLVAAEVRRVGKLKPELVSAIDGGARYFGHMYAKIRPLSLPRIMAKVDYKAAIHEFGHCLGLPDEYRMYDGMTIAGAHAAFDALCEAAHVRGRPYPAKHDSIMSCGMKTYPSHYVTILDCMKKMTGQDDWVIA